ncbi:MAG: dTMP kinase [Pseudomonadota bacterium]
MTFITFEGPEGAGKSTQIKRLADALRRAGRTVTVTREPGGTKEAEVLREILLSPHYRWSPLSEALLMNAARDSHVEAVIKPALFRGDVVLCDRFFDSTEAYQGGEQGISPQLLSDLRSSAARRDPDLTIILDLPAREGLARAEARGAADRFEAKGIKFHDKVRARFLSIAERETDRCAMIDARPDVDAVTMAIQSAVSARLPGLLDPADGSPSSS